MLLDAFNAERFRMVRDRGAMFWGVVFPALFIFALSFLETVLALLVKGAKALPTNKTVNLAEAIIHGFNWANAFPIQLFVLLGVSAMFAADYRWETWRLQTPRNSRANLMVSKFMAFAILAVVALLLLAAASVLASLAQGVLLKLPFEPFGFGVTPMMLLRTLAAGWLELMVVGSMAALIATVTRSNMAGLLIPVFVSAAQYIGLAIKQIHPGIATPEIILAFPNMAAQVLRGDGGPAHEPGNTLLALAGLNFWAVLFTVLTVVLFRRQELTRE